MSTTTVKVLDANKEIASHTFKKGEVLVIQARDNVNYQLVDDVTGRGPQNILAKRDGKNLVITIDQENNQDPDIIIENYYGDDNGETTNLLVGLHENGNIYAYVPESGEVADAVSMLAEEMVKPQALGGHELKAFLWAFNPWWLAGLGVLAAGVALAAGSKGGSNKQSSSPDNTAPSKPTLEAKEDGSIDLGLPADAKTGDVVEVTVTPEGSNTPVKVTLTKQADGSWTSSNPDLIPNTTGNQVTIPADKVADNTPVTVVAKDPAGNTSEPVSTTAGTDGVAPSTPTLDTKDNGDVELELPTDAGEGDKVEVTLTPTGSDKPVVVTLTKGPNGWESDNPAIIPNPTGDKVTVPGENVEDNTPVTVVAKDGETGKTSEPVSANTNTDGVAPSTPTLDTKDNGDVELELPTDADEGDKVEVTLTPTGSDKPVVVTLTKGPNGWESDNPAIIPNPTGDKVTVPGENVEDNTPVTVVAKDGETGKTSEPVTANTNTDGVAPSTPTLDTKDNGDVELELPTDADEGDKVEVTLTPTGSDKPVVVTLTKGPNGWESDNPAIIPNPTGDKATVPGENVEDNTPVTVVAKDGETGKTSEPVTANTNTDGVAPTAPKLDAKDNGDVELELPTDADEGDKVEVTLTPTGSDKPVVVTLTKGPNGWESDNPAIIPNPTGDKATVPGENVEDNTPVTVVAKDGETGKTSEPVTANTNTDGVAPTAPKLDAKDNGDVELELPTDADEGDKVEVTLTPEGTNDPITVTLTKGPNGWTSDNKDVIPDTVGDKATIPGDKVEDNTPVTVVSRDGETGKASEPDTQTASPDKDVTLTSPTLDPKDDGSVEVGLPTDAVEGDKVEVTLTPEGTNDPITVTLTKGPNGWESDNPAVIPNPTGDKATIPADSLADDTPVTVISRDGETGKTSDPVTKNAGTDGVAPTAPTLEPQADGSLDVGLPTDADAGDKVEVTITPEGKTEPEVVTLTKQPDGSWTSSNPDLVPNTTGDKATIPADSVADNTPVTVVAKDGASDKASDPVTKNAGTDGVAPTAPTLEPQADGSLDVGLPTDADAGDKVEVTITPEGKTEPEVVTLTKQPDGSWTSSNPDLVPNTTGDKATIPADSVADNTPVTVVAKDGASDKASDPVTKNAGTDGVAPTAPTLEPQADGSLDVGLPTDADAGDKVEVTITPEGKTEPEVVTLTKQPDGSWTSSNPDLVPNTTGDKATIPADSVADNTPVTVVAKDGASDKASDPVTKNAGTDGVAPTAPTLEPQADGSLDVGLPTDADAGDKVEVTITPEGKTEPEVVTLTKQPDGSWTSSNPDLVPNTTGDKATIPADSVADNTPVTVVAKDGASDKASDPVTKNAGTDGVAPTAPTLEPQADGSLDVGLPTDADAGDKVEVTITPEGKTEPEVVTLTKQPDGSWTSDKPTLIPNTTGDKATIPADSVADNTPVTVVAKDGASDKASDPVTKNSGTDTAAPDTSAPAEPTVTNVATDDKATTITGKAEPNATVEVKDKDGNVVGTAKADENGNYTVTTDKPLADGEYDVVAKDAAGNTSDPEKAVVDTQAPEAPTVTDVKTDENGTTVTGTAEPNATIELKDKDGNVVGTATADDKGNYTVTTDKPLADGEYDVVAKDAAGNDSAPATATVDTTAPAKPEVTDVKTDENGTTVTGTAEPNATVELKDKDGNVVGTATADDKGNYTVTTDKPLADGDYDVVAKDEAGNDSAPATATVDTTAPEQPKVTDLTAEVDGNTVKGTTEPGATVKVKDKDGNVIGEATADENGNYEVPVKPALTNGETYQVTATDKDGNESEPKDITGGQTDFTAPDAPTVTDVVDNGDNTNTVKGTAEPGSTVKVTDPDGNVIGETTADKDGNYEVKVPALEDGKEYDVTATDKDGNESDPEVIDLKAPEAPTVTDVKTDENGTTVTGTAEPNATVELKDKDGNVVGTATADDKGNYTVTTDKPLADGDYDVVAKDEAGNDSAPATATVDTTAPEQPKVTDLTAEVDGNTVKGTTEPGATVKVKDKDGNVIGEATADENGNYEVPVKPALTNGETYQVTATDKDGNESEPKDITGGQTDFTAPDAPTVTDVVDNGDNTNTVKGTAEPGSTVKVTDPDGKVIGETTADKDGNYEVKVPALEDGKEYDVTATDKDGNESDPEVIDLKAPEAPTVTDVKTDENGTTVTGTAEPNATVELKDKDGNVVGTATVDDKGNYTVTTDKPLADGDYDVVAKDEAGNDSAPATATVDTTAPAKPEVTDVKTDENGTTVTGTAEPNATVELKDKDGNVVGTATADDKGNYTVTTDKPLADGDYDVVAKDEAGNDSAPATATVDTTAPSAPTFAANDDGSVTVTAPTDADAKTMTVKVTDPTTGEETPVTLTKGDDGWTSSNPDVVPSIPAGQTSTTIPADKVKDGSKVKATATDANNNTSPEAESEAAKAGGDPVVADTTAPAAPTFVANDNGSVTVTAPTDADAKTMTVKVTDPVTGAEKTVELAKQDDGSWKSNDEATVPSIPAGQTSTTIPADKVKDGSKVKATATDANNNTSPEAESEAAKAGGDPVVADTTAPAAPTFVANENGSVTVTAPTDADAKTMTVKVTDPVTGAEKTVELAKQDDGSWKSNDEATVPSIPAGQTSTTIPADKVKDGTPVKATATDATGNTSPEVQSEPAKAGGDPVAEDKTPPAAPTFVANENGSVTVTAPTDADAKTMTVKVTDPVTGAEKTVELAKQDDGSWKSNDEATVPSIPAGQTSTTIPADKVKDGTPVKATATDATGNTSPEVQSEPAKAGGDPVAEDKTPPAAPTFVANENGSVTVTAPTDADAKTMTVKVTDPVTGAEKTVELAKQDDGSWKSNDEETVPSIPAGQTSTTIPADKVKDGSKVKATATDANNNTSPEAESEAAKAGGDPVDSTVKPVIDTVKYDPAVHDVAGSTATPAGTVTVTAGADSTNLTFSFYNEVNNQARATETAFGTEGVAGTTDSIAITAVPSSASQQVKDSDQNGPTTAHQTTVVQSNKVDVVAEKVNGTWTIKSITETTPDGQVVAAANQDARVSVNGDVFTIHHNGVMGGTTVTATGSNGTESADATPKVAETDAPAIKPKAYIETVAELSDTMKAVLTDAVRKEYGITDKHLVINPETLEAQGYTNFLIYSTNANGGAHRDAIVKGSNGWVYGKEDGTSIILGSPAGKAEGYYVNNDMIVLPASFSNDMKEGTEIKLFTADFDRGGDWQYLDSTIAGPAIITTPPATESPFYNYRLTYKGTKPANISASDYTPADQDGNQEFIGTYFHNGKESIRGTNWLNDFTSQKKAGDTGMVLDLKDDGYGTTITWVYEPYLRTFGSSVPLYIRGDSNDAVDLGHTNATTGRTLEAYQSGRATKDFGYWTETTETVTLSSPNINNEVGETTYTKYVSTGGYTVYIDQSIVVF